MMARSKQAEASGASRGVKKTRQDQTFDGTAIEREPVDQADQTGGQVGQARPSSPAGFSVMTLMALALSILAVAGVTFLHYKIATDTQQAVSAREEALVRLHDVLGDRLGGVETRLATLEATAGNLRQEADQIEAKIRETANASADDLMAAQSLMTARLGDVEAQLADLLAAGPAVSVADVQDNAASTDKLTGNLLANQTMPDQLAVLIVMGLLSDDAAGRSLARWAPALSSYAKSDAVPPQVDNVVKAAITYINASPPPADSLFAEGLELAAAMSIGVNEAGEDASLFDRARASLGQMLRLRSTRMTGDDPRSQLARFDLALSHRDLVAAADIAGRWNGPAVEGLEIWHQNALSRLALNKVLTDLTAAIIGMVG